MILHISEQAVPDESYGLDNDYTLIKTKENIPINWFGSYVYIEDLPIKAVRPLLYGKYNLALQSADNLVGKEIVIKETDMDNNIGRFNSPLFILPDKKDDIKLYRLNTDYRRNNEQKYIFLSFISTQKFYNKVWEKAIKDKKIKFFKIKSKFSMSKAETVLCELQDIVLWCEQTYGTRSLEYRRIKKSADNLESIIKAENNTSKLYIF